MFNEREMSKAIDWLFELFSPEDYEGYDEDEIGYAGGLCLPVVCVCRWFAPHYEVRHRRYISIP